MRTGLERFHQSRIVIVVVVVTAAAAAAAAAAVVVVADTVIAFGTYSPVTGNPTHRLCGSTPKTKLG